MARLPPCPRCKGQPRVDHYRYSGRERWYVLCGVCRFRTEDSVDKAAPDANSARQRWYDLLKSVKTNPKLLNQKRW